MSKENHLKAIEKFWPKDAPEIKNIPKYVSKYKKEIIVIKYGGNVLIDRNIFNNFIEDISILNKLGLSIIVVHSGGPRIERQLKKEKIQTKFIIMIAEIFKCPSQSKKTKQNLKDLTLKKI